MTMHIEARVKLYEKMGWTPLDAKLKGWYLPPGLSETIEGLANREFRDDLPDPSTDPAADYAVLEWMQDYQDSEEKLGCWFRFCDALTGICNPPYMAEYELGYYAKAACLVYGINYDTGEWI